MGKDTGEHHDPGTIHKAREPGTAAEAGADEQRDISQTEGTPGRHPARRVRQTVRGTG